MPKLTKIRLINPSRKYAKKKSNKTRGAKNPKHQHASKFVLLGGAPTGRSNMAKMKKKKRPGKNYRRAKNGFFAKSKKRNPSLFGKKRSRRRKSNPWIPVTGKELLYVSGGALAGGLGARIIPENTPGLSQYNNGLVGYGMNLAAGYAVAKLAGWLFGAKAEEGALAGAILMTGSRFVSDRFGRTIVSFGRVHLGNDPAFRLGKYVSAAQAPLSPLPVGTTYPASGPVPPLPVGTSLKALPAATGAAAPAGKAPLTVAAASSMGAYGRGKHGVNRFM
jgi:hypothetical protein